MAKAKKKVAKRRARKVKNHVRQKPRSPQKKDLGPDQFCPEGDDNTLFWAYARSSD